MQIFAVPLAELYEVPVSPFLQPVVVPLDGSTTLWSISHSSRFGVISKLAEDTFCTIIQIINEDVKQDRTQYWPLGCTSSHWPLIRLCNMITTLCLQLFSQFLVHCLLIQPVLLQLLYADLVEDSIKSLTEVKVDNILCSPFVYHANHFIVEGYWLGQSWLPCGRSMLTTPDHLLVLYVTGNSFQDYLLHHFSRH